MNEQSLLIAAPDPRILTADFGAYCAAYRRRQDALSLIKQLTQMTKAVQRHRGMSMAQLAGSQLFHQDFDLLQRQLERRLTSLEVFAAHTGLLSRRDKENLHNAWRTIRADWQGDHVLDNFELHSHFIEQLQAMIAGLAKLLECSVSAMAAGAPLRERSEMYPKEVYPKRVAQIELLDFAARQVIAMAEQIARIRGLATYAAVKGFGDDHHDRKLRYAVFSTRAANQKLRHQTERLEVLLASALPSLPTIKLYELKLMFLLNTVEEDILSGKTITTNSYNLFKLATEIIDVYLHVVDDAMDLASRWNDEDLEGWLCAV